MLSGALASGEAAYESAKEEISGQPGILWARGVPKPGRESS